MDKDGVKEIFNENSIWNNGVSAWIIRLAFYIYTIKYFKV